MYSIILFFFFFSSRRRHTRYWRDGVQTCALPIWLDPSLESVGVLMEPTTIVAKAWDHIERIAARAYTEQRRVLVTGAGPIGLLAALLASQRELEVHVLDRVEAELKPSLVRDLGATYHHGSIS